MKKKMAAQKNIIIQIGYPDKAMSDMTQFYGNRFPRFLQARKIVWYLL